MCASVGMCVRVCVRMSVDVCVGMCARVCNGLALLYCILAPPGLGKRVFKPASPFVRVRARAFI